MINVKLTRKPNRMIDTFIKIKKRKKNIIQLALCNCIRFRCLNQNAFWKTAWSLLDSMVVPSLLSFSSIFSAFSVLVSVPLVHHHHLMKMSLGSMIEPFDTFSYSVWLVQPLYQHRVFWMDYSFVHSLVLHHNSVQHFLNNHSVV